LIVERFAIGVIVERRPAKSRWQSHVWRVVEVLPGRPATPAWSVLHEADGVTRYYAGTTDLVVYGKETEALVHNLGAQMPAVWVVLRPREGSDGFDLLMATVDAGEAQAHADTGDDLVEMVAMPEAVRAWLTPFVAAHHVERPKYKRKRDRADPEALAAGRLPGQYPGGKGPGGNGRHG
jgi:hypothetical protein